MVLVSLGMAAGAAAADYWSKKQAAKQNFSYQKQLSNLNFQQQKYFAQNAHQMEIEDLKKAGLNPALTATGGSGASASGGGIAGSPGIQPLDMIGGLKTLIDAKNQTSATQSQNDLNRAQAMNTIANTDNIPYQNRINMINALAAQQQAEAATTNATTNKSLGDVEIVRKKGTKKYLLGKAAEKAEIIGKKYNLKQAYKRNLKAIKSYGYLNNLPEYKKY